MGMAVPGSALAQNHPGGARQGKFQHRGAAPTATTPPPATMPHAAMPRATAPVPTTPLPRPVPVILSPTKQIVKNAAGEQFFIISSVDIANSQVLLKRPTEVTVLAKVNANTKFLDQNGKPEKLTTFRAGDTVWARLSNDGPDPTIELMQDGEMTMADLHKYYLDY